MVEIIMIVSKEDRDIIENFYDSKLYFFLFYEF